MERDRSLAALWSLAATAALSGALVGSSCGVIERTKPASDDGDEPSPFAGSVRVLDIEPSSDVISTSPQLEIQFNTYLEDDSFNTYNSGSLSAGALGWGGWAEFIVTDKTLVWESRRSVPAELDVRFALADRLESITGAPVPTGEAIAKFTVDDERDPHRRDRLAAPRWSDVDEIFENHCRECHADSSWNLVRLEPEQLVGEPSSQVERLLVKPYDPADSYLLQKLMWDYPELRYSPQPPPWSGAEELSRRQKRTVERWIEIGAPDAG